jgi:hypothetical protein
VEIFIKSWLNKLGNRLESEVVPAQKKNETIDRDMAGRLPLYKFDSLYSTEPLGSSVLTSKKGK